MFIMRERDRPMIEIMRKMSFTDDMACISKIRIYAFVFMLDRKSTRCVHNKEFKVLVRNNSD